MWSQTTKDEEQKSIFLSPIFLSHRLHGVAAHTAKHASRRRCDKA